MMPRRVLIPTSEAVHLHATGLTQFDYPVVEAGSSTHFTVYRDPSLGAAGQQVAAAVLGKSEADYLTLSSYFGLQIPRCNVIIAPLSPDGDGSGGAYHYSCNATDLYCDVALQPQINVDLTSAFVVAEEVEVFQAVQSLGWDCGSSNGEGLSRVLAESLHPNVLSAYATAGQWLDGGRPNWVDANNNTDTDPVSNGCSVLFLFWLNARLDFPWDQICQAANPTLRGTYRTLTGKATAWPDFLKDITVLFPADVSVGVVPDNPF